MAFFKNIVLIALVAVVAVAFAQQVQAASIDQDDDIALREANWTACDITTDPVLSCHNCNTRLICKAVGGLLITCRNPYKPYCANGICSPIPSPECV